MHQIWRRIVMLVMIGGLLWTASHNTPAHAAETKLPTIGIDLKETDDPGDLVPAMKIMALLTILSMAPAILLMMTSFTRILVILSFVRQALGTSSMPPNQVIVGLALFLTAFTMSPVIDTVRDKAYTPYVEKKIKQDEALEQLIKPVRKFMLAQTHESDLAMFFNITKQPKPRNASDVSMTTLMPAFMVSELKTAFQIGFLIYIPFLVIDMVVSSILMAMGMMMLPPTVVSLPFKLVLFVLVDGWTLIVENIVKSFNI
ncbi:MAG: flagellar type III secretion system pore protein FliP [Proteobacteria bacterium]|nr:flagellar type III secretion system pore protein FliP [Pseudomonadota bacterium]